MSKVAQTTFSFIAGYKATTDQVVIHIVKKRAFGGQPVLLECFGISPTVGGCGFDEGA